ncbi:MAG TPA: 30S ribosomal protein S16 [Candidatus Saccharimonadales bacterium]|nr:30S ribosomal protein S16 [Candidatus Saccharimonadales bacterium]
MLAIRLQRHGRKAAPVYRVAVQEAQRHPSSGRVVAYVGAYNPHTKESKIDAEKVEFYLKNGAQPSPRVVRLLEEAKVNLPAWVKSTRTDKAAKLRNPDKLRKNQPKEEAPAEAPADEAAPAEEKTEE